ncbi:hypothetical protein [Sodalis-like endosymbiont of Proechinophthirus fluctus]|uniref:hypothetical protein n=1 Tax=Sodalis-like endosymbiont of Proechinophthirus fluctus TaxID=1462730 RepID=UPI00164F1F45|nr:hypothetical protein [Sodalis-like endosymbiont of Proechinophthirus fluctus]
MAGRFKAQQCFNLTVLWVRHTQFGASGTLFWYNPGLRRFHFGKDALRGTGAVIVINGQDIPRQQMVTSVKWPYPGLSARRTLDTAAILAVWKETITANAMIERWVHASVAQSG